MGQAPQKICGAGRINVENKKIDVLFGVVVIAFLAVTFILIKEFNAKRANDYKEYSAAIANIVKLKNDKIIILSSRLAMEQKENADLRNTLSDTRNDLEGLTKKLGQPVSAPAAPAAPVAPAVPVAPTAPAAAAAPVAPTATK